VPLGRGPPRSRARRPLGRGPPRSRTPARACPRTCVRAFNALTQQGRATTLTCLGITPRRCPANSRGEAIPAVVQHCAARPVSAPRHCAAYPRTANTPRPRRGAGGTLEYLRRAYTGPRRDVRPAGSVIPVVVNPVRPSPPLPHHVGRCGDIPTLLRRTGTRHRHNGHCATYGPPSTAPSNCPPRRPVNQPLHRRPRSRSCTGTGRTTTPQQERDSPGRPSALQHCSPYLRTQRNSAACM
jgi:hypothetical protein